MHKSHIIITEKGPLSHKHVVVFDTVDDARRALKAALLFWSGNNHDAVMVESKLSTVIVSSDMVASVVLKTVPKVASGKGKKK